MAKLDLTRIEYIKASVSDEGGSVIITFKNGKRIYFEDNEVDARDAGIFSKLIEENRDEKEAKKK